MSGERAEAKFLSRYVDKLIQADTTLHLAKSATTYAHKRPPVPFETVVGRTCRYFEVLLVVGARGDR